MLAMIKINLLPSRKVKRQTEPGLAEVVIGTGSLLAAGVIVFMVFHRPLAAERDKLKADAAQVASENAPKRAKVANLSKLKATVDAEEARNKSVERLAGTTVIPDNVLHELGEILTPGHLPTMSRDMADKIGEGIKGDPNKKFAFDWDPKHVWLTSFTTKGDTFTLEGGAQSEGDVPQLAKRMAASVYFSDVTSPTSQRYDDKSAGGVSYYKFTISGKVVY